MCVKVPDGINDHRDGLRRRIAVTVVLQPVMVLGPYPDPSRSGLGLRLIIMIQVGSYVQASRSLSAALSAALDVGPSADTAKA